MQTNRDPLVMGILNVTPDSFSDGDRFLNVDAALAHAERLIRDGADILDIGGESTRPGSEPVDAETEKQRVLPILAGIRKKFPKVQLSIDTYKPEVAEAALAAGAAIINDIKAATDIRMAKLAKEKGATLILMHMQNTPKTMQEEPKYPSGVLHEVTNFLKSRVRQCLELGIPKEKVWIDPGIGFGKTVQHNLDLLRRLDTLSSIGSRLVIGTSRKGFISSVAGDTQLPFEQRLPGTLSSNLYAFTLGASVFRVHDVKEMKRALRMWTSISYGI